jgi:tetratricopeptide (TPR) repeat protein
VTATSPKRKDPITLKFHNAWADHDYAKHPITTNGEWNIATTGEGRNCTAIWSLPKPAFLAAGTRLTFEMEFWGVGPQNLGHFHLSVSSDPRAIDTLAATQLTDPWAKLAAAYHIIGTQTARDTVVKHHPAAAAGVGDLYAAARDWERAIAEYGKAITAQTADVDLLTKLATAYQAAGRTREGLPYLARASAGKPQDTFLAVKVATLQAWFGQDQELAATRKRILAFARGTDNAGWANDAARICSLAPVTDAGELEAALALGHTGVKLKRTEWTLLSAGMAEYRSSNYAAADEALGDAANANPNNRTVLSTAALYRAMNLFRQGKEDEARQLASATAAKMRPLPKDEQNPLAGGVSHDELILWLTYKEAKASLKFDAAPPPHRDNDKK